MLNATVINFKKHNLVKQRIWQFIFVAFNTVPLVTCLICTNAFAIHSFDEDYALMEVYKQRLEKANAGNSSAQYNIALMFEHGKGVKKSQTKAFQWYSKAAKQGNDKAAFKIGFSFLHGKGVSKNYTEAIKWLNISAQKGNARAFYTLGYVYEIGKGVEIDLEKSLHWYNKAKADGYSVAEKRIAPITKKLGKESLSTTILKNKRPAHEEKTIAAVPNVSITKISTRSNVTTELLAGGWSRSEKPALILPSRLTQCITYGKNIECTATEINSNIGFANIRYATKSVIHDIEDSGNFVISYRKNILGISITDKKLITSGDTLPIKLGWQDKEHFLTCSLKNNEELNCRQSELRDLTFSRVVQQ